MYGQQNTIGEKYGTTSLTTGNSGWGVRVSGEGADDNVFESLWSGTDTTNALGNGLGGLLIEGGADQTLICQYSTCYFDSNQGPGISLQGPDITGTRFFNHDVYIGNLTRPNQGPGVLINGASGTSVLAKIIGNTGDGVRIQSGSGSYIYGSEISGNGGDGVAVESGKAESAPSS